jgi:hypothetical protein
MRNSGEHLKRGDNQHDRQQRTNNEQGQLGKQTAIIQPEPKSDLLNEKGRAANQHRKNCLKGAPPNGPRKRNRRIHIPIQFRCLFELHSLDLIVIRGSTGSDYKPGLKLEGALPDIPHGMNCRPILHSARQPFHPLATLRPETHPAYGPGSSITGLIGIRQIRFFK